MTISMPDSIYPAYLAVGYPAYLGYVDGSWPTAAAVRAAHPGAHVLTLTVLGGPAVADGCDRESGDLSADSAVAWVRRRLAAGARRPVIYASASAMFGVLDALAGAGVSRASVRLLSAHYTHSAHICGPATCRYAEGGRQLPAMDGTQWTDQFPGPGGSKIDMSLLAGDFFGATAPAPSTQEDDMLTGEVTTQAHIPFPAGSFKRVMLMRDFTSAAHPAKVRVACHSISKGAAVAEKTITSMAPVSVEFGETDVNAVSISVLAGSAVPVGWTLAAS